jgi:hypothetical protein
MKKTIQFLVEEMQQNLETQNGSLIGGYASITRKNVVPPDNHGSERYNLNWGNCYNNGDCSHDTNGVIGLGTYCFNEKICGMQSTSVTL